MKQIVILYYLRKIGMKILYHEAKIIDANLEILSIIEYGLLLTRMWVTTSCANDTIGEMAQLIQLIRGSLRHLMKMKFHS